MLEIKATTTFSKKLKKYGLSANLIDILHHLVNQTVLPEKYRDHQLKGDMKAYRECHVKPDLLLVYQFENDAVLLTNLDSHANLFKK